MHEVVGCRASRSRPHLETLYTSSTIATVISCIVHVVLLVLVKDLYCCKGIELITLSHSPHFTSAAIAIVPPDKTN